MKKNSVFLFLFILFHLTLFASQLITIAGKFTEADHPILDPKMNNADQKLNRYFVNEIREPLNTGTSLIIKGDSKEVNAVIRETHKSPSIQKIVFYNYAEYGPGKFIPGQSVLGN